MDQAGSGHRAAGRSVPGLEGVRNGRSYDVRLLWDSASNRFLASATNGTVIYVAVSATSDAAGAWYWWQSPVGSYDEPKLEVTADKVLVVSYDHLFVLEKQDLLSATAAPLAPRVSLVDPGCDTYGCDNYTPPEVSSTSTGYLVHRLQKYRRGLGPDGIEIETITGTPARGDVQITASILNLAEPVDPAPQPPQPPDGQSALNLAPPTGEVDSAVWADGGMWIALGQGCAPPGDSTMRSCLRLLEVSTTSSPTLIQDVTTGVPGSYLSFPGVTADRHGDAVVVATLTSTKMHPSTVAAQWSSGGRVSTWATVAAGEYDETLYQVPSQTYVRWGDYSSAATDPTNPERMWVGAEMATSDGTWGTAFAAATLTVPPVGGGYWLVASDGGIFGFDAPFLGSTGNVHLNQPVVGMAPTADDGGYYLVAADGGVFTFGDARYQGSTGSIHLNKPIVGMAVDRATGGYWLVASDGGIFGFDAPFLGSTGNVHLNQPVVGMAPTADDGGYYLVAADGGVFTFGDARYQGSTGSIHLNKPIVGMAVDRATGGYWLVASDGGIFGFDAPFLGSTGNVHLNQPVVGMAPTADDGGYYLVAADGGVFTFGDARYQGSTGSIHLNKPIVGMAGVG